MANERVATVLLRYVVDQPSARRAVDSARDVNTELGRLRPITQANVTAVRTGFDSLERETREARRSVQGLADDYKALDNAQARVIRNGPQLTARAVSPGASLDTLDRAGSVGSQILSGLGAGEAANAAGLVGDVAGALTTLGPVAGVAAGLLGTLAVAQSAYNRDLERSIERTEAFAGALERAFEAGTTGAIEDLAEQQRQINENKRQSLEALREVSEGAQAQAAQSLDNASTTLRNWLEQAAATISGTEIPEPITLDTRRTAEAYQRDIERLTRELEAGEIALESYEYVLSNTGTAAVVAANDLEALRREAEAVREEGERALAQGRAELRRREEASIQDRLRQDTEIARLARQAGIDTVTERLRAIEDERAAIAASLPELRERARIDNLALDTYRQTTARLEALNQEFSRLNSEVAPEALARAREEFTQTVEALTAASGERIAQIEADRAEKLAEIDRTTNEARAEAERKAGADRVDLAKRTADAIARIERDFSRASTSAVQDRNAVALDAARQARADALAEQNEQQQRSQEQIDEALREQNRTIEKRYEEQTRDVRNAADRQLSLERQRLSAEIALRNQAYSAQLQQFTAAANAELGARNTLNNAILSGVTTLIGQVQSAFNSRSQAVTTPGVQYNNVIVPNVRYTPSTPTVRRVGSREVSAYQSGGNAVRGEVALVGERGPELVQFGANARIYPTGETMRMLGSGGLTLNLNGLGLTPRQVGRMVERQLEEFSRGYEAV